MEAKTLRELYRQLEGPRQEFIELGHISSVLTIPSILPRDESSRVRLTQNFQSVGSRGVNNLASKLMLTLFNPTLPFMRLEIPPSAMEALAGDPDVESDVQNSLLGIETEALSIFDTDGWRPAMSESMLHLIIGGNSLLYDRPGGRPSSFDMRRFVVDRDSEGNLLSTVLRQEVGMQVAMETLGDSVTPEQLAQSTTGATHSSQSSIEPLIELFTGAVRMSDGRFQFWQEIGGFQVEDSVAIMREEDLPLMPLRFQPIYGASYGRGYVEHYHGDLLVLESLSRALSESSIAAAKVLFMVRPGATTKPASIAKAPNLAVRSGDVDDVGVLRLEKGQDMGIALQYALQVAGRLSNAFLLNSSVQRPGERVTAEEIRFVAQELEDALGGVYSSLADTVQRLIVNYIYSKMKRDGKVDVGDAPVQPVVASGLDSISRNHKVGKIREFLGLMSGFIPPERYSEVFRLDAIAADLAAGFNLDVDRYVLTPEEVAAAQQSRQAEEVVRTLGPDMVKQAGNSNDAA